MRLQLTQSGARVQVQISYRVAMTEDGTATWSEKEACAARYQLPGYKYDNPGTITFRLSLRQPTELVYDVEAHWNVPCANNHPIGTERTQKILRRQ